MAIARECGVEAFVENRGQLPRAEAQSLQQQATLLLQLEWVNDAARGVFTGKFFEYLGAGRPILAVGPTAAWWAMCSPHRPRLCRGDGRGGRTVSRTARSRTVAGVGR